MYKAHKNRNGKHYLAACILPLCAYNHHLTLSNFNLGVLILNSIKNPGGSVVKNLPAIQETVCNTGDAGLIPG